MIIQVLSYMVLVFIHIMMFMFFKQSVPQVIIVFPIDIDQYYAVIMLL